MSFDAGEVAVTLGGKFSRDAFLAFDRAVKGAAGQAKVAETALVRAGHNSAHALERAGVMAERVAKVSLVGLTAGAAAAAIGVEKIVSVAADYQKEMAGVRAVTKATGSDFRKLHDLGLQLGASTGIGARQAAKGMAELAKGGVTVRQILGGALKGAIALAQAGELPLADAASTVANALNLFALKGADATHVADALATAANATTADVGDFAMALSQGGSAAKAAGLTFDETVVSLEALAKAGIKNSDAGTSLKTALVQLLSPTKQQAQASQQAGISFLDQHNKMRSLTDIAGQLRQKTGDLTGAQRVALFSTLAGTDGLRTLLALYDAGPKKLQEYEHQLKKHGTAQEVANAKMKGFSGTWTHFTAAVESAAISIGEQVLPLVTRELPKLTDWINKGIKSGDFKKTGQDIANTLSDIANGAKNAWKYIKDFIGVVKTLANMPTPFDAFLAGLQGVISLGRTAATIGLTLGQVFLDVIGSVADAVNSLPDPLGLIPNIDTSGIKQMRDDLEHLKQQIRNPTVGEVTLQVRSEQARHDVTTFFQVLRKLPKRQQTLVWAETVTAQSKVAGLVSRLAALTSQRHVAHIFAESANAETALQRIRAELAALQDKTITVRLNTLQTGGGGATRPNSVSGTGHGGAPTHAAGHKTSGPEFALIGEGAAPEYVIPTEPRFRGRAIGLLMDAAHELGIAGYKAGTKKKGKSKAKTPDKTPEKPKRTVPPRIAEGGVPFTDVENSYQDAKGRYDQSGKDLSRARETERKAEARLADAKTKAARAAAQKALDAAKREVAKAEGHRARLKPNFERRHQDYIAAKKTNDEILNLQSDINILRDGMELDDRHDDTAAFNAKKDARGKKLEQLRKLLARALKLSRPGSEQARSVGELLSQAGVDADTNAGETDEPTPATAAPDATAYTQEQQDQLDRLEGDLALAGLTPDTADDLAILKDILGIETAALNPSGPAALYKQVAQDVASTQQQIDTITSAPPDQDTQAQLDQANARADSYRQQADANAAALAAFGSQTTAGGSLAGAGPSVTQIIQTLHPGDPRTHRAIAEAAATGFGYQGGRVSPRVSLGY